MAELEIETADEAQRLRCPNGHVVAPTNEHWYCYSCSAHWTNCEADFEKARDAKTGRMLARDEVRFGGEAERRVPG